MKTEAIVYITGGGMVSINFDIDEAARKLMIHHELV
jgi:hypothetical protein